MIHPPLIMGKPFVIMIKLILALNEPFSYKGDKPKINKTKNCYGAFGCAHIGDSRNGAQGRQPSKSLSRCEEVRSKKKHRRSNISDPFMNNSL